MEELNNLVIKYLESSVDLSQNAIRFPGSPIVFVSHSSEDWEWVDRKIIKPLEKHKINVWYSGLHIKSTSQWEREILRGLEISVWFLLVVSPRSEKSEWVKDELGWAIDHRPGKIAPVIMEDAELYNFHIRLPRIQYIDFRSSSLNDLFEIISGNKL